VIVSLEFHLQNEEHYAKTINLNSITIKQAVHTDRTVIANSSNIAIKNKKKQGGENA